MITFYTYPGPNGRKAQIMLEESGLQYDTKLVDIKAREQFAPAFLQISPNNKIPAIVDHDAPEPIPVFETGAILLYLAQKTGRLLPTSPKARANVYAWLFWGTGSLGGTLPQVHHFSDLPAPPADVLARFTTEAVRLFQVLERRLEHHDYVCGDYSIADIPAFCTTSGWLARVRQLTGDQLGATPSIDRWLSAVAARPAVQRVS